MIVLIILICVVMFFYCLLYDSDKRGPEYRPIDEFEDQSTGFEYVPSLEHTLTHPAKPGQHYDDRGYLRFDSNNRLVHRHVAYKYIYLVHRDEYPLPFSSYDVHHINHHKWDNRSTNLEILTREEHMKRHSEAGSYDSYQPRNYYRPRYRFPRRYRR